MQFQHNNPHVNAGLLSGYDIIEHWSKMSSDRGDGWNIDQRGEGSRSGTLTRRDRGHRDTQQLSCVFALRICFTQMQFSNQQERVLVT